MITLDLTYPPSVNHYFSYQHGRPVLSKDARDYRRQVRRVAVAQGGRPFMGPLAVRIEIFPPDERRRDCDNVQKAVLDALQHAGFFWDDSQVVWLLSIKLAPQTIGAVKVKIDEFNSESVSAFMETE